MREVELPSVRSPSRRRRAETPRRTRQEDTISEGESVPPLSKRRERRRDRKKRIKSGEGLERTSQSTTVLPTKIPSLEESTPLEEEEVFNCRVARTALIQTFTWNRDHKNAAEWASILQQRVVTTSATSKKIPLWLPQKDIPPEVVDLSPQFRQILGWRRGKQDKNTWTSARLVVNEQVMKDLFSKAKLCTVQNEEQVFVDVEFVSIELVLYPLNCALLVFHINWIPNKGKEKEPVSLNDVRTFVFVAKHRHKVNDVCLGWNFFDPNTNEVEPNEQVVSSLGEELCFARFKNHGISLGELGNWLVLLPGEEVNSAPSRVDLSRRAQHHTTVVIDQEPPPRSLYEYLFHLRNAYGQRNRPPTHSSETLGRVLIVRKNRYFGISRNGSVSISWDHENHHFESTCWYKKFQGIYFALALHVHAERLLLFELGELAASQAENLKMEEAQSRDELRASRNQLRYVASLVARFTLSMSSNETGGLSEYAEFFTILRQVLGIPELRAELSGELKDVLAVVESTYLEEERAARDVQDQERRKGREREKRQQEIKNSLNRRFDIIVSILGSFLLPFIVISGIWGMNLDNLPSEVDFYTLICLCFVMSFLLLILLLSFRFMFKSNPKGI